MFFSKLRARQQRNRISSCAKKLCSRNLAVEPLEDRRLLSLIPVAPLPWNMVTYDSTGHISYDPVSHAYNIDALPLIFKGTSTGANRPISVDPGTGIKSFQIRINVDNAGNLLGGVEGPDLLITGSIPTIGAGTLLTGEISRFGFLDDGPDQFDFRFTPTGGLLKSYFSGQDIGITTNSETSTFANNFNTGFTGTAKGNVGSISPLLSSLSGNVYLDADNNGLFDSAAGETGIANATVRLTGTNVDGAAVNLAAQTSTSGAYSFSNLRPGNYSLAEVQPAGYLDGIDTFGTPGGTAGNDVFSNIVLAAGVSGMNNNFGESPLLPAIQLVKLTNGTHDPSVPTGSPVTWTYQVSNTGNVPLSGVTVADNDPAVTTAYVSGDANGDNLLDANETWIFSASGTAAAGHYSNTGTATGVATDATGTVQVSVSTTDTDHYFGAQWAMQITKYTNDTHNPKLEAGSPVAWTYEVANLGNVALANLTVSDDQNVTPIYQSGDADADGLLDPAETWVYTAAGTAIVGQYTNIGTATAQDTSGLLPLPISVHSTDGYFGVQPGVSIVKLTNGANNANANIKAGSTVNWIYDVTNTGNVALSGVTVTDSDAGVAPAYASGDANANNLLDVGETWVYSAAGTAIAGQYNNLGSVSAADATGTVATPVSASEGDSYFGVQAGIQIVKLTNGADSNSTPGLPVNAGSTITWTYNVLNTGNVPLSNVTVTDSDPSVHPVYQSGDANANGKLDIGETWKFTAIGTAIVGQYANTGTARGTDATGTIAAPLSATAVDYYFGKQAPPSSLSGFVYDDANNNGEIDLGELALDNVMIKLTGVDDLGNAVSTTTATDADGAYFFRNLRPGTYAITELTQPANYLDGISTIGSQGGTVGVNQFINIVLNADVNGINNNFAERLPVGSTLRSGQTATIGFWHNKNGQALIKSLNGNANATSLGNWLAQSFPNIYGVDAGSQNLTGKTNTQIANYFLQLFGVKGQKLDAQVLAVALATYVTNSSLAGLVAAPYGFVVSSYGTGAATYNVGTAGALFDVANNTRLAILEILYRTNEKANLGILWDIDDTGCISQYEQVLRNLANDLFTAINEVGDIN
jgi:hypothetical protein